MTHQGNVPAKQTPAIDSRFDALELRLSDVETDLKKNIAATLEGNRDAREMLEIFQAVKGGFKVLGWLANVVRWAGYIAGAAAAFYAVWHTIGGGPNK